MQRNVFLIVVDRAMSPGEWSVGRRLFAEQQIRKTTNDSELRSSVRHSEAKRLDAESDRCFSLYYRWQITGQRRP